MTLQYNSTVINGVLLKILHQNIRGLLANKSTLCQILDGFRNIDIFSVSETHLSLENEAEVQIESSILSVVVKKTSLTADDFTIIRAEAFQVKLQLALRARSRALILF